MNIKPEELSPDFCGNPRCKRPLALPPAAQNYLAVTYTNGYFFNVPLCPQCAAQPSQTARAILGRLAHSLGEPKDYGPPGRQYTSITATLDGPSVDAPDPYEAYEEAQEAREPQ